MPRCNVLRANTVLDAASHHSEAEPDILTATIAMGFPC